MSSAHPIKLNVAGLTDVGKKRQRNEDSMRWNVPEPGSPLAPYGTVLLVCDGMGGVGQGDIASQTAVEKFFAVYNDPSYTESNTEKRVQQALETAHQAVREAASSLGRLYIGTTVAGVVIRADGSGLCFNLGDSRVYRLRGETFEAISKDQSVNAAQLERGEITPEQAVAARNNNITMFIGHPLEMTPNYVNFTVQSGDIYMVCSDGLWDVLREAQLREILKTQSPEQAVRTYVDQTLRNGAPDNVTVIIASTRENRQGRRVWPWLLIPLILAVGVGAFFASRSGSTTPADSTTVAEIGVTDTVSPSDTPDSIPTATNEAAAPLVQPTRESASSASTGAIQVLPSRTPTNTDLPSETPEPSATGTPTDTPTDRPTATETGLPTETATRRPTRTPLPTETPHPSITASVTPTPSPSRTPSATRTATPTATATPTSTDTPTVTPLPSATATPSPLPTATPTDTPLPSATFTGTPLPSATDRPTATSTSNAAFWVLQGTPTAALQTVTVARFGALTEPPLQIYLGNIERRFTDVTEVNPFDAGSRYILVYLAPNVLDGHRFWWLVEDVQPQFEVLIATGIRVYSTARFDALQRSPLAEGELVIVTGITRDGEWFKIRSRRGEGWVSATILEEGWVRFLGDINDVPVVVPPPLVSSTTAASATPEPDAPTPLPPDPNQPPQPTNVPAPTNPPASTAVPPTAAPPTSEPPTAEPPTPEPPTPEPPTPEPPTPEPPTPTTEGG